MTRRDAPRRDRGVAAPPPYAFDRISADVPNWAIRETRTGQLLCWCSDQDLCEAIAAVGREPAPVEKEGQR